MGGETRGCRVGYRFEFRSLGNQSHNVWARKVMAVEGNSNKMLLLGIKKVLDVNPFSY